MKFGLGATPSAQSRRRPDRLTAPLRHGRQYHVNRRQCVPVIDRPANGKINVSLPRNAVTRMRYHLLSITRAARREGRWLARLVKFPAPLSAWPTRRRRAGIAAKLWRESSRLDMAKSIGRLLFGGSEMVAPRRRNCPARKLAKTPVSASSGAFIVSIIRAENLNRWRHRPPGGIILTASAMKS